MSVPNADLGDDTVCALFLSATLYNGFSHSLRVH